MVIIKKSNNKRAVVATCRLASINYDRCFFGALAAFEFCAFLFALCAAFFAFTLALQATTNVVLETN
jgi:hypothetical protein